MELLSTGISIILINYFVYSDTYYGPLSYTLYFKTREFFYIGVFKRLREVNGFAS